jgi:hypothetical protein
MSVAQEELPSIAIFDKKARVKRPEQNFFSFAAKEGKKYGLSGIPARQDQRVKDAWARHTEVKKAAQRELKTKTDLQRRDKTLEPRVKAPARSLGTEDLLQMGWGYKKKSPARKSGSVDLDEARRILKEYYAKRGSLVGVRSAVRKSPQKGGARHSARKSPAKKRKSPRKSPKKSPKRKSPRKSPAKKRKSPKRK